MYSYYTNLDHDTQIHNFFSEKKRRPENYLMWASLISPWVITNFDSILYLQGSDFWVPSKKYIGDGAFPEKIVNMDLSEISQDRIDIVAATYISHPEWDVGNNQDFCFDATHSAHRAEYCRAAPSPIQNKYTHC